MNPNPNPDPNPHPNPRSRAAARADEELSPYLPPSKRLYVFGALAPQAARFVMWLLPELKARSPQQTLAPAQTLLSSVETSTDYDVRTAHHKQR